MCSSPVGLAGHAGTQNAWQAVCPPGAELGTTRCRAERDGQQAAVKFIEEPHLRRC